MEPGKAALSSAEATNFPHGARGVHREMRRRAAALRLDSRDVAARGLLIRHLVLPNRVAGSREVSRSIAGEFSRDSHVIVMRLYRPEHQAPQHKEIACRITMEEYAEALGWAREAGLHRFAR